MTVQRTDGQLSLKPSPGGLATGLSSVYQQGNNVWLGWPGSSDFTEKEKKSVTQQLHADNMSPVFLNKEEVQGYYEGFSNDTLWPLFHYFTEFAHYSQDLWDMYEAVNRKFCESVLQIANPNDVIWVHDYQLLLLPGMLREALPDAAIGFFQHIPFPSYEIFRLLPWRKALLEGMIGADLVGFHTFDDVRHFLSSVSRLLGHNNTMGRIRMPNRLLAVDAFPMGIDYEKFAQATHLPETIDRLKKYFKIFSDTKTILSIDRLDYSKGIKQRIEAFDRFLEKYPSWKGKVSLVVIVVPSRIKVKQYQQLKEEIDTLVGSLNGKYSQPDWLPIHYFYRSFNFHALSALYSSADVALITPLRDGMNLVCKEYIASKMDKRGVLILSEMAGAAKELSEAILINPNDRDQVVEALKQALEMPAEEQIARNTEMQSKLKRYNVHRWVQMFMQELGNIKDKQQELTTNLLNGKTEQQLLQQYANAQKKILFLDYDGTLKGFVNDPQQAHPDPELLDLLERIAKDPRNQVVIISGRDRHTLFKWLGHLPVDMIAEHGVWSRSANSDWHMLDTLEHQWKEQIRHILEIYVDRTPGSFIEDKDYSLVWHYRKVETEYGDLRARDLLSNLHYLLSNMDLQALEGNKVIEIRNRDVNKGRAARKWMGQETYDFIFAIGDDATDEDTFRAMPEEAFTIKVGLTQSVAKLHVKTHQDVRKLLLRMAAVSTEK